MNPTDLLTVGVLVLLEALLSADNALVLGVLVLGLPRPLQKKALRYGLAGAFAFRLIATLLAVHLFAVAWVQLAGGLYLLNLTIRHFRARGDAGAMQSIRRATPWIGLSAFWATVVKVELTDIVFAVDSILVAVAITPKTWVIVTGGMLGIVAMRMVTGQLVGLLSRYPQLVNAAFVIVGWVGLKLLIESGNLFGWVDVHIPTWASLGIVFLTLAGAALREWVAGRGRRVARDSRGPDPSSGARSSMAVEQ